MKYPDQSLLISQGLPMSCSLRLGKGSTASTIMQAACIIATLQAVVPSRMQVTEETASSYRWLAGWLVCPALSSLHSKQPCTSQQPLPGH